MSEFVQETAALTRRWAIRSMRTPMELVFGLLQPLLWLVLFGQMFKGIAQWNRAAFGTDSYLSFQMAGILVMTVFGFLLTGGVPILFDREFGFLPRLMAAPISRASIVLSRALFLAVFGLVQCALILALGWAMGAHLETGVCGIAAILAVCTLLGIGFTIVSIALAFVFPNHQVFFAVMGFITTPVLFTSNALMPLSVMPVWLQWVAMLNPLTYACTAIRTLTFGARSDFPLWLAVLGLVAFDALVFAWANAIMSRRPWFLGPRPSQPGR